MKSIPSTTAAGIVATVLTPTSREDPESCIKQQTRQWKEGYFLLVYLKSWVFHRHLFTAPILMSIILTFLQHFKPSPKYFLVRPGASYQHEGITRVMDFLWSSPFMSVPPISVDAAVSPNTTLPSLTQGHFGWPTSCMWICGHECAPPTTEAHPLSPT